MSRGAHSFKQGDVTKAVKGLVKAGATDWRIEIVKGKITLAPRASRDRRRAGQRTRYP
jgi:hypothetical protein